MMVLLQSSLPIDISTFIRDPETALLVILLVVALYGSYKGWWVPGPIYKKAEERAELLAKSLADTTEAIKELTAEIRQRGL